MNTSFDQQSLIDNKPNNSPSLWSHTLIVIIGICALAALGMAIYAVTESGKGEKGDKGNVGDQGLRGFTFESGLAIAVDEALKDIGQDYKIHGQYAGNTVQAQFGKWDRSPHPASLSVLLADPVFTKATQDSGKINYIGFQALEDGKFELIWNRSDPGFGHELVLDPLNPSYIDYVILVKKDLYTIP